MDPYRIRCFVLWLYYSERVDNIRKYTMHFNNRISCVGGIFLLFVAIKIFESKSLDNYFPFVETVAVSKKYIRKLFFFSLLGINVRIIIYFSRSEKNIATIWILFVFLISVITLEISVSEKGTGLQKLKASAVFSFNHRDQLMVPFAPPRCVFLCLKNDH